MVNLNTSETSFWTQLETKQITNKKEIEQHLCQKLGTPTNQLALNCLTEITKKITSYYSEETPKNFTTYTLIGSLSSPANILERKFREGKRLGQSYYILKVGTDNLQVIQEEIAPDKWDQIKKLAIIGQELVFKYRKYYTNKQLLDYYPKEEEGTESP